RPEFPVEGGRVFALAVGDRPAAPALRDLHGGAGYARSCLVLPTRHADAPVTKPRRLFYCEPTPLSVRPPYAITRFPSISRACFRTAPDELSRLSPNYAKRWSILTISVYEHIVNLLPSTTRNVSIIQATNSPPLLQELRTAHALMMQCAVS